MEKLTWFIYASIAVWVGIGLCIMLLGQRQARLTQRLTRLEQVREQ